MSEANLGMVLIAMAEYARRRADERREELGRSNAELLWAISHMLFIGARKCMEIAEDDNAHSNS